MSVTAATRPVPTVRGWTGLWRARLLAAVMAGLALIVGACGSGGSSGPGVASVPTASSSSSQSQAPAPTGDPLRYAQCMRSHGVPNFPDPNAQGGIGIDANQLGVDPNGPVFRAAERACRPLAPSGAAPNPSQAAEAQRQALAYSRCMRSHGITNFPDPTFSNGRSRLQLPPGVNPGSPQFKAADKACKNLLPQGGSTNQEGGS